MSRVSVTVDPVPEPPEVSAPEPKTPAPKRKSGDAVKENTHE